jgi:hypothetical protein
MRTMLSLLSLLTISAAVFAGCDNSRHPEKYAEGNFIGFHQKPTDIPNPPPPFSLTMRNSDVPALQTAPPALLLTFKMTATGPHTLGHIKAHFTTPTNNALLRATYAIRVNGQQRMATSVPVAANEPVILSVFPVEVTAAGQEIVVEIYATVTGALSGDTVQAWETEIETNVGDDRAARAGPLVIIR